MTNMNKQNKIENKKKTSLITPIIACQNKHTLFGSSGGEYVVKTINFDICIKAILRCGNTNIKKTTRQQ